MVSRFVGNETKQEQKSIFVASEALEDDLPVLRAPDTAGQLRGHGGPQV